MLSLIENQSIYSREVGANELVEPMLGLSALSASVYSTSLTTESPNKLSPSEVEPFLQDLTRRFEPDNEIDGVLGPVVRQLLFHPTLLSPQGLSAQASTWRGVISGLEAIVSIKPLAIMLTRMDEWNPTNASAQNFELVSLLGPICRLGVFSAEWVSPDFGFVHYLCLILPTACCGNAILWQRLWTE